MNKTQSAFLILLLLTAFSCEKIETDLIQTAPEPEYFLSFEANGYTYQFADRVTPNRSVDTNTGDWSESTSWVDPETNRRFGFTLSANHPIPEKFRTIGPHSHERFSLFTMANYHTHAELSQSAVLTIWYKDEWGQMWFASQKRGGTGFLTFSSLESQERGYFRLKGKGFFAGELTFNGKTLKVENGRFSGKFLLR